MFFEFPLRRTETLKILVMHFHGKSMVNPGSPSQNHPWTNHWKYHKILSLAGAPYVDPVDQSYPILSHIIPYYPQFSLFSTPIRRLKADPSHFLFVISSNVLASQWDTPRSEPGILWPRAPLREHVDCDLPRRQSNTKNLGD